MTVRMAVFDTPEGAVTISFPDAITRESVADLEDYLTLMLRTLKRIAERNTPETGTADENISKNPDGGDGGLSVHNQWRR